MIHRLVERKPSLLGTPDWLEAAEALSKVDADHQVCSFGFSLSMLAHEQEHLLQCQTPPRARVESLLKNIGQLFQSVGSWHQSCTCYQIQPRIGVRIAPTEQGRHTTSEITATGMQLIHCITLIAMQLLCHRLALALITRKDVAQLRGKIRIDRVEFMLHHSQQKSMEDIVRLSQAFLAMDDVGGGRYYRVVWSLNLVREGYQAETGAGQCDALLPRFTELMNSIARV
jgi:hypothetical protein